MKLKFTRIAPTMLMAAAFAIGGAMEVNGQVFVDTFDAAPTNGATRALSIDNSGSITPGTFPSSRFDVFGIVDRNVNFDFADDSVELENDGDPLTNDTYGLVKSDKTDLFLGFEDTVNDDNPLGDVSVTWTVSTAGQTNLAFSFDVATMGDFEDTDILTVKASFDGGAQETLFTSSFIDTPDDETFSYTLENGSLAVVPFSSDDPPNTNVKDPFVIDGTIVDNNFQNFSFPISGTGTELTLVLEYNTNGSGEAVAIDNVTVTSGVVSAPTGDLNGDEAVDCLDIDEFIGNLGSAPTGALADHDLDSDGDIDLADVEFLITNLIVTSNGQTGTFLGDLNCDGTVNVLGDAFTLVGGLNNAATSYAQGDINLDGTVNVLGDAFTLIGNLGNTNAP